MKKIDEIFKDGLDKNGLEFSENYWNQMESILDKDPILKKKRKVGMLWVLAMLIGLGGLGYSIYSIQGNQKNSIAQNDQGSDIKVSRIVQERASSEEELISDIQIEEKASYENKVNAIEEEIAQSPNKSMVQAFNRKQNVHENKQDQLNINTEKETNTEMVENLNFLTSRKDELSSSERVSPLDFSQVTKIDGIGIKPLETNQIPSYLVPINLQNKVLKYHKFWSFYLLPVLELVNNKEPIYNGLESDQKSKERMENTLSYGLHLAAKKGNLAFKLGINLNEFASISNYTKEIDEYAFSSRRILVNRNFKSDGNGGFIALVENRIDSTFTGTRTEVECKDCKTKASYVSIPLSVQYELKQKRFTYFGELGFTASFLNSQKGNYITVEGNQVFIKDLSNSNELNKVVYSADARIGIKYPVLRNVNLWGSYGYNFGLSSMTKTYTQKVNSNRTQIGLEFKL